MTEVTITIKNAAGEVVAEETFVKGEDETDEAFAARILEWVIDNLPPGGSVDQA